MSIALGLPTCLPVYDSPAFARAAAADDDVSSCGSSIGRNSEGMDDGDEGEVQSSYKGPLDTMDSLEDSLPTRCRQANSSFYCGKSKSYANLTEVVPLLSPTKDSCNREDMYSSRKRKDLLSFNLWEKKPNSQRRNGDVTVSKRPTNSNRTTATTTVSSSSGSNSFEEYRDQCHYPYDQAVARKRKVSLMIKPFLSAADLEGVPCSTPPSAESGRKQREVI